jgi:class 3 adenylate cyclase
MTSDQRMQHRDIGHVLFIDVAGSSNMTIDEQTESVERLYAVVRETKPFKTALRARKLMRVPFEHGMAFVFRDNPEEPAQCAVETTDAMRLYPKIALRMGIYSGPVDAACYTSGSANIPGDGIDIARRITDCGEVGHILLSQRVADELARNRQWRRYLHQLGECQVKNGVTLCVANLHTGTVGNASAPKTLNPAQLSNEELDNQNPGYARPWFARSMSWKVAAAGFLIAAGGASIIGLRPLRTHPLTRSRPDVTPGDSPRIAAATSESATTTKLPESPGVIIPEPTPETTAAESGDNAAPTSEEVAVLSAEQVLPPSEGPTASAPAAEPMPGERFPQTRTRSLGMEDLRGWSAPELRYAINELYARGGYDFRSSEMKSVFSKQPWYQQRRVKGRTEGEAVLHLSGLERANLRLLQTKRNQQRH